MVKLDDYPISIHIWFAHVHRFLTSAWDPCFFLTEKMMSWWIWGRGYAKLPVHEFLLAVDDSPQKFELLIGIARQEATLQSMRDFGCKQYHEAPQSFSPYEGGKLRFFCFSFKSWQCKTANQAFFVHFVLGFSEQSYIRYPVFMMLYSYLCLKPCSRLLQILIFIYYRIFTIVCSCPKKFVSRFHKTGELILGYWSFD